MPEFLKALKFDSPNSKFEALNLDLNSSQIYVPDMITDFNYLFSVHTALPNSFGFIYASVHNALPNNCSVLKNDEKEVIINSTYLYRIGSNQ